MPTVRSLIARSPIDPYLLLLIIPQTIDEFVVRWAAMNAPTGTMPVRLWSLRRR